MPAKAVSHCVCHRTPCHDPPPAQLFVPLSCAPHSIALSCGMKCKPRIFLLVLAIFLTAISPVRAETTGNGSAAAAAAVNGLAVRLQQALPATGNSLISPWSLQSAGAGAGVGGLARLIPGVARVPAHASGWGDRGFFKISVYQRPSAGLSAPLAPDPGGRSFGEASALSMPVLPFCEAGNSMTFVGVRSRPWNPG